VCVSGDCWERDVSVTPELQLVIQAASAENAIGCCSGVTMATSIHPIDIKFN